MRKPESLAKPTVVSYLAAHVERLTKSGVFKGRQSARTVFMHLSCHPDANAVPGSGREPTWACPVAAPHHEPAVIAEATGLSENKVRLAINWLEAEGLIDVDRESSSKRKYKMYGPIMILSTNQVTERERTYRNRWPKGPEVRIDPLPPAKGPEVQYSDATSLSDDPRYPGGYRRTVAERRATWAATNDSGRCDTLKASAPDA